MVDQQAAAGPAAPTAVYDPSGLLGTSITVWRDGVGRAAMIVELDHVTGKNRLRVHYAGVEEEAMADEWIDRSTDG